MTGRTPAFTSNPRLPFQMSTERPPLAAPDGKPLIVHILVALEHWRFNDHMPRHIMPAPHGLRPVPDVPNWSWAEYGMRCGMPRLLRVLGERGIKADACINAGVLDAYPSVAEAVRDAGWEFQGHGIAQRAVADDADERALIHAALDKLEKFCGYRPRGWTGPGLRETMDTLDLLREAGVVYTCDWVVDDLPCWSVARERGTTRAGLNEATLVRFLDSRRVDPLFLDEESTHHYARLFHRLRRQGTPIPTNDLWIAALVVQHQAHL